MFLVCVAFSLIALTQAATLVPVHSSKVDVRQSSADFSYNIQEHRGISAIDDPVPILQSLVKTVHLQEKSSGSEQVKGKPISQEQVQDGRKIDHQGNFDLKDLKKPEEIALIAQPIFASPLDYYGYSIHTLPKASLIPSISTFPAIPYPYTLIKTI